MSTSYVGLGSNVGDRMSALSRAVAELDGDEVAVTGASSVYETDPVGPPQDDYLNAVVRVSTTLGPRDLLRRLKDVEDKVGRRPSQRWGPREIDLDLLLYEDVAADDGVLRIPHPEMHARAFVLVPLVELAPDVVIPGAGRAADLLAGLPPGGVRRWCGPEPLWAPGRTG